MKTSIISDKSRGRLRLWAIVFWIAVWQLLAMAVSQDILLAAPTSVFRRLCALMVTAGFWQALCFSMLRILAGFLTGCLFGIICAALAARHIRMRELIAPFMALIRAIPVASFVIVALVWIPSRNLSMLIAAMITCPVVYANVLTGIDAMDPGMREVGRVFRLSPLRRLMYICVPAILPHFTSAIVAAMGLAWKAGVAAEVIGIPAGSIGENLYMAKVYLMTPDLFAWTFALIAASVICEKIALAGLSRFARRLERM